MFIVTLSARIPAPAERYVGAEHNTPLEHIIFFSFTQIYETRRKIDVLLNNQLLQDEIVQTIVNIKWFDFFF